MRHRPKKSPLKGLALVGLLQLAPAPAWSQTGAEVAQQANALAALEVNETATATEIIVTGSAPPTFAVFKLTQPNRLFVDVSNADVSAISEPIDVDNGVIEEISAVQYQDEKVSVGRIIIGLEIDALYEVKAEGNRLRITVDGSRRRSSSLVSGSPEAEQRARDAERRAAQAEARLAQAEAGRQRAEAELARLEQSRQAVEGRIRSLEGERSALTAQLDKARAEKDATLAARLEAEQRAREAELKAEKALAARLSSDQQVSALSARLTTVQSNLEEARRNDQADEVARLQRTLSAVQGELAQKTQEADLARTEANTARQEADRVAQQSRAKTAEAEQARLAAEQRAQAAEAARRKAETELERQRETALARIS
ncbi:MAG: AMIN domain-containing protein, partial [Bradymonadia bacterium]